MSHTSGNTRFENSAPTFLSHSPLRLLRDFVGWLIKLQDQRMARIQLRSMDEHMLKDIGLTRGGIEDHLRNRRHF
jgi:uncharacterized protein YjiS (DUF1127 family)